MLRENRNILELIILILLQKLFGKKLCTYLDFATNFWEREQMNLRLKAIPKYENHPSILRIKNYMKEKDLYFSFEFIDKPKISKEINKLDEKKACQEHDIPAKLIKSNKDLFSHFIYHNFNNSLFSSNFPSNLKAADILPTHKKKDKSDIENYRSISILPTLSKIYERCMYDEMYKYFDQILSKYQCGFRQGYNTQHCLLVMVEK